MEKPVSTILYTSNLRGDISMLPRLYSFLRQLRAELNPAMVLDLGDSCAPDAWHCQVTEGRSMLIALDAMGYTAARVPVLSSESREKLTLTMALVDDDTPYLYKNMLLSCNPLPPHAALMGVCLTPAPTSYMLNGTLNLEQIEAGQIGIAVVALGGTPVLIASEVKNVLPEILPDPTIAGVVDFVLGEARYYQKRQSEKKSGG